MNNSQGLRLAEVLTIGILIFSVFMGAKSTNKLTEIAKNTKK